MSKVFSIKTNMNIDIEKSIKDLFNDFNNLIIEKCKEEHYFFYYLYGMSTRGVEITITDQKIEIRNRVLSNRMDLFLTYRFLTYLSNITESNIYDECDEIISLDLFTDPKEADKQFMNDVKMVLYSIGEFKQMFEFPGTTRSVYIGNTLFEKYKDYEKNIEYVSNEIQKLFLKVLYDLPDYREGALFGSDSVDEENKIIKLKILIKDDDYIITNYDYIMLENDNKNDEPIMLNLENIKKILPKQWELIDECTIIAPKLEINDWVIFKENAKRNNCYQEFTKKTKKK